MQRDPSRPVKQPHDQQVCRPRARPELFLQACPRAPVAQLGQQVARFRHHQVRRVRCRPQAAPFRRHQVLRVHHLQLVVALQVPAFALAAQALALAAQALAPVAQVLVLVAQVVRQWVAHVLVVQVAPAVLPAQAPLVLVLVQVHAPVARVQVAQVLDQVAAAATDPMVNVAPLARSPADVDVATWTSCSRNS